MLTFQQMIQKLTEFWEKQGCIIHQGYDLEVGAGTFNPSTFLRCLGPEPYKTAYVEPSRRPSDGRYGENPNRVQLFHQYQVIIKPTPENIQALYLDSLRALGFDLKAHDIRFVHDDWEGPTLGAWGLGWEVWCDGMEITQFTYFQAIGSIPLTTISAEITYGLERLAMFIQGVESLFDVKWNDTLTFGDISKQSEIEWSTYNFEAAHTDMWHRHFEDYEKEARSLIQKHLPIPAYDFVLKASHAFNMLDARGVISVTERTGYIARIRDLARLVATDYLASREEKNFPLLKPAAPKSLPPLKSVNPAFDPSKTRDFLLEIGSEQLPAAFIPIGMKNLKASFEKICQEKGLSYKEICLYGSPQRLAIHVKELAEGTKEKAVEKKGPLIASAFDLEGNPTTLGSGFLKSIALSSLSLDSIRKGSHPSLEIRSMKGSDYLFYTHKEPAMATLEWLALVLPKLIKELEFPKKMRWSEENLTYARPIRSLLALFGEEEVPFYLESLASSSKTRGHAQLSSGWITIASPKDYLPTLREHFVLADPVERKAHIEKQLVEIEERLQVKAVAVSKVLPQVLNLTEWPTLMTASFKEEFLKAPPEVLICEMVEHQKYFPLEKEGKLQNLFLITADNTPSDLIAKGNQKVLSARLFDGVFLYEQDVKTPLSTFNEKLKLMTFQKELGSMADKVERLTKHASMLQILEPGVDTKKLFRSALLCKADLASALVGEFPELQGVIGKYYALAQEEPAEVALAIEEHWMPKSESAPLPTSSYGALVSLADKIDNLLGYFSIGLKPTSSSDPYALKRQTFGLLKIAIERRYFLDLEELLKKCATNFPNPIADVAEILTFITARAKSLLEEYGFKKDEIEAGLQRKCCNPYLQFCKIQALHTFRKEEAFGRFYEVYKRVKGFLDTPSQGDFNKELLTHPAEEALLAAIERVQKDLQSLLKKLNFLEAFRLLAQLAPPLSALLSEVKIQVEEAALKESRIALIRSVFALFGDLLDFSKIQEL